MVVFTDHMPLKCPKIGRTEGTHGARMQSITSVTGEVITQGLAIKCTEDTLVARQSLLFLVVRIRCVGQPVAAVGGGIDRS